MLEVVEQHTFCQCKNLKHVNFPESLEEIGIGAFGGSGLDDIEFPASLRVISQASFAWCESLKTAKFNEGLKVLGMDEYADDSEGWFGVFEGS